MKYFQLNPNVSSRKWKGYLNPKTRLVGEGGSVSAIAISNMEKKIHQPLFYNVLDEGGISPINTLGSRMIMFDSNITNIESLNVSGVQLVPIVNKETQHTYFMMHLYKHIDCVSWRLSKYDPWPANYQPAEWENKKARFFIKPCIDVEKIPSQLCAFRLVEWGDAFNIVISEELKYKILSLDFDHSFLEFHELAES